MQPGYAILDHPADLGIEARGKTLAEAFQQAASGLVSVILDPSTVEPRQTVQVTTTGSDRYQLLVKWLSEILYLYDGKGFVAGDIDVQSLTERSIAAMVRGETFSGEKHVTRLDVKAVTYHQIHIEENEKGAMVRVYLDI